MADYIYLLENRLSAAQRSALRSVRELAKAKGLTTFLVGGAVRDLTSGSPVRDLDVVVQGNATKLKKDIEKAGGILVGEHDPAQTFFVRFSGGVAMEVSSTLSITFPKPGKPVYKPATILEDLRRRDFTANAMALSLNEGSYGLLMDPLNGVADIENRQLRLVSNYGFIEDPVRMIRAARLMARLGWTLDERTEARYETGKAENYIAALSEFNRGYETEELVHEEDPLRVMKRLEAEGWMKVLAPYWTSAKVNVPELERLRETQTQMQMQGIHPGTAAASFPLLTAKLTPKEVATLKAGFPRQGFVAEIDSLEAEGKDFTAKLGSKAAASPSSAWKLITSSRPEAVLWTAFTSKSGALQAKFKSFYQDWPQARTRIPYALMQEMRIVPELPVYDELLEKLFFELMDEKLTTPEEMKAFLEPYSPPAPPPPVSLRRPRAAKKETKSARARAKKAEVESIDETAIPAATGLDASENVESAPKAKGAPSVSKQGEQKPLPVAKVAPPVSAKEAMESAKGAVVAPAGPEKAHKDAAAKKTASKAVPAGASTTAAPGIAASARSTAAASKQALKPTDKPAPRKSAAKGTPAKAAPVKTSAKAASQKTTTSQATKKSSAKPPVKPAAKEKATATPLKGAKAASKKPSPAASGKRTGTKPPLKTGAKGTTRPRAGTAVKAAAKGKTIPAKKLAKR